MPDLGQAQTGQRSSTPKVCKVDGDDSMKMVYRHMGNNHAHPFLWADELTVVSGATSVVVASGIKFHGMPLATNGTFVATPEGDLGRFWITKNTSTNVVTFVCSTAAGSGGVKVGVMAMLGSEPDLDTLNCRGNVGATQSQYIS
jgi:hypothetical protein